MQLAVDGGSTVTPKATTPYVPPTLPGEHGTSGGYDPYGTGSVAPGSGTPSAGQPAPTNPDPGPNDITVGGSPGSTPDYNAAIQADPGYAAAQSANQQAQANAQAQRQAALRSAVVQYGGLPSGWKDAYGDIDQATLDAATGNQYSTLANLRRSYDQSVSQFRRALAARGALQSGDLNYGQDQLDTGYGQSQYDAANQFGNAATGQLNAYAGVLDQNQARMAQAIQAAAANAYNDPANRPVAATPGNTATRDAALSAAYGVDVYTDANGNHYTRGGDPWTAPVVGYAGPTFGAGPGNGYDSGLGLYGHGSQ